MSGQRIVEFLTVLRLPLGTTAAFGGVLFVVGGGEGGGEGGDGGRPSTRLLFGIVVELPEVADAEVDVNEVVEVAEVGVVAVVDEVVPAAVASSGPLESRTAPRGSVDALLVVVAVRSATTRGRWATAFRTSADSAWPRRRSWCWTWWRRWRSAGPNSLAADASSVSRHRDSAGL